MVRGDGYVQPLWEACAVLSRGVTMVACPACHLSNMSDFRFCSVCGYERKRTAPATQDPTGVDLPAINARLQALRSKHLAKKQSRLKEKELIAFEGFLRAAGTGRTLQDAIPLDVLQFLVWRDLMGTGQTVVHSLDCEAVASASHHACGCPRRLSYESVRKIKSVLAAAFSKTVGRSEPWSASTNTGNPVEAPEVQAYVAWIHEEQAKAGVGTTQATPLLIDKLRVLCTHLRALASDPLATPFHRLEARRELAWYLLAWHSSIRNGQIGGTFIHSVIRTSDGRLLFNWTWGKTVRDRARGPVAVSPYTADSALCPVKAIHNWVAAARAGGWAMTGGYLFPVIRKPRASEALQAPLRMLEGQPGDAEAMNLRLRARLKQWSTYEGETLNGTRSGGALHLKMQGASASAVDAHVGWTPAAVPGDASRMQEHYTGESRVCGTVGGRSEGAQDVTPTQYREWNSLPLLTGAARQPFLL